MIQSDTLYRRPDHIPEEDTDNEDLVLLLDKLFINFINVELAKMIKSAATSVSMKGVPPIKSNLSNWKIEDRKLFYQNQGYIPDNDDI